MLGATSRYPASRLHWALVMSLYGGKRADLGNPQDSFTQKRASKVAHRIYRKRISESVSKH